LRLSERPSLVAFYATIASGFALLMSRPVMSFILSKR